MKLVKNENEYEVIIKIKFIYYFNKINYLYKKISNYFIKYLMK